MQLTRGHDDHVAALEQRPRRRQPHPVDLVVDRRFLLDVGVAGRDVGLGLVVVVVADEVLDGVVGEEAPELLVELRRQRLVVGHDQRRPVHPGDDLGHGEGLARAGDAEQRLMAIAAFESGDQLGHGVHLIAGEVEVGDEGESVERCRHADPAWRRRKAGGGRAQPVDRTTAVPFTPAAATAGCGPGPGHARVSGRAFLPRPASWATGGGRL